MESRKKFPTKSLVIAVLSAVFIAAFFIFWATAIEAINGSSYVLAVFVVCVLLLPIALAMFVIDIKSVFAYISYKKIMDCGRDGFCTVVDYKSYYHQKRWNARFALVVRYTDNGAEKRYTTKYDYVREEYRYLKGKRKLSCKIWKNKLVVTEEIPAEFYEELTVIGHVKSKFVRTLMRVWQIFTGVGALLLFVGIALTVALETGLYLIIGVVCLVAPNVVCGLIFAVCFFMKKV